MVKYSPKLIQVTDHPIIIVGERPGKTRDGSTFALQGNRTGDFVHEAVGNRTNIILTNLYNILHEGKFEVGYVADGIIELINLIEVYDPSLIITLGNPASTYVNSISIIKCPVYQMPHPSFINRFHSKHRHEYINQLSYELDKRVPAYT